MKLVQGKKLIVFFGFLLAKTKSENEDETKNKDETKNEERPAAPLYKASEEWKAKVLSFRNTLVEGLNKSVEIKNLSDLFVKLPPLFVFNPMVFKMHMPLSMQRMTYVIFEQLRAKTQDFEVVYDGAILMVAALCDLHEIPWGVFDIRDRLLTEVFKPITKVELIPPCLSSATVSFVLQDDKKKVKDMRGLVITVPKPRNSKDLLRDLYKDVSYDLGRFMNVCIMRHEINKIIRKIPSQESKLFANLLKFLTADWKGIFEKRRIVRQCKIDMSKILKDVSIYTLKLNRLNQMQGKITEFAEERATLPARVIRGIGLNYTRPSFLLDTGSVIKSVEHVRNEIEMYSLNTSTLFSALVGALIGSLITLIASLMS